MTFNRAEVRAAREAAKEGYRRATEAARRTGELDLLYRRLALDDLFFLLVHVLGCGFADNDWVFFVCREFEADPDGHLDVWSREHYKSTVITLAAVVQAILRDPNLTVGIFSFNRPIAKAFLRVIKWQFESNERLRKLFPDILWDDPSREAPKWSEDDGIVVRRDGFPKEMTVEAWGLVDGQPTSKHYALMVYDDVVTRDSVTTPEMIAKVTEALSLSFNLGQDGGRRWMLGTFYHYADTYATLISRGAVKPRIHAATVDGTITGEPVLWTSERLAEKVRDMGSYVASAQLFCKPLLESEQPFRAEWLQYWLPRGSDDWRAMNRYIVVDPANEKRKESDYTTMVVFGLAADRNYYVIDMVRDKLSLVERTNRLFALHAMYRPLAVGYEKYGMQSDIQHMQSEMSRRQYRFRIEELGGNVAKVDRIKAGIQPLFEARRVILPERCVRVDYTGQSRDLTQDFIADEFSQFPYMAHDDMLDCMSRITDAKMCAFFPDAAAPGEGGGPWEPARDDSTYDFDTYAYA